MEKGMEKGARVVARNMLGMGFVPTDIQKATKLPLDAVISLRSGGEDA
jgi:hypothetical protein